jgi:hypothetical protein
MELTFGQRISGLTADGREVRAAVFDEHEVRAADGLTMVIGGVAFAFATFEQQFLPLQIVTAVLAVSATPSSATRTRPPHLVGRHGARRAARAAVLRYFRAAESEYACVFTANASGALRLARRPRRCRVRRRHDPTTSSRASACPRAVPAGLPPRLAC